MKAELVITKKDWGGLSHILYLRPESDEDQEFLDKVYKEGLRNFGGGSYNTLALPSEAGLVQIHVSLTKIIEAYKEKMENME